MILCALGCLNACTSENLFDAHGRLEHLALGAGWLDIKTELRVPLTGWGKIFGSGAVVSTKSEAHGRTFWSSRLGDGQLADVEAVQTARDTPAGIEFEFNASAFKDSEIEGVIFWIDLPAKIFAGGAFEMSGKDGKSGTLPLKRSADPEADRILCSGMMDSAALKNPDGSISLQAQWSEPVNVTLQDSRQWGDTFSLMVYVHRGTLLKGSSERLTLTLRAVGQPELTPAEFSVNPEKTRYKVEGIGGNYCFSLGGPERLYTLENLKPTFARTEISLQQWAPERGGNKTDLSVEKMPGKLRLEFETLRELKQRDIPFIASVWQAPQWLCRPRDPLDKTTPATTNSLKPKLYQVAAESVGYYLLRAKELTGAEPLYFSFNEPDYGAQLKFTPEELRDAIKIFGAHFKRSELRTKMLLGDVSNPRGPLSYVQPTLDDAEAMQYVGAVSIHSWGGATPAQYGAWAELAQRLKLPLFVAEAGVDPGAWQDGSYKSFANALRELAHYQELFRYAQPQAVLYWEYTGDYSLFDSDKKGAQKHNPLTRADETERFALQQHWTEFVLPGSAALEVSGEHPFVQLNVFKSRSELILQLSNTGWPRPVVLSGLPAPLKYLNVFETSRGKLMQKRQPLEVKDGTAHFEIPAQAFWTLTDRRSD